MKKILNFVFLLFTISNINAQLPPFPPSIPNADSTSYYMPDGTKNWFHYQKDVAVFRYAGGAQFTDTLPAFVTSITWDPLDPYGYNIITFDTAAPGAQCAAYWYYIHGYPGFEYGFIPTTKNRYADASENKWYMGNDKLLITFKHPETMSPTDLAAFMSRNLLTLYSQPDPGLPHPEKWTWIFTMQEDQRFLPFDAASRVWYTEQSLVYACEPDMIMSRNFDGVDPGEDKCYLPTEISAWGGTVHQDALWYIKNHGQEPYQGFGNGTADADTKVCECWGAGYDGTGMKVAVVDVGGFDFTHPDLAGQFLPGFDFINNVGFTTTHFAANDTHGMAMASAIGAIPNGGQTPLQTINTTAVGMAYGAKILPYITNNSNAQLVSAVQKAVLDGADVINFSNGQVNSNFTAMQFHGQLVLAQQNGRSGLGCIIVGATGNDDANVITWPAAMDGAIGVGASDENDLRGSYTQVNPWTWQNSPNQKGSNYMNLNSAIPNRHYDVVAPGTDIRAAITQNGTTSTPFQTSSSGTGTSPAAAITSGIAAIVLQKNPTATYVQVQNMINASADKVYSGPTYNYSQYSYVPGYATETFFGRINCIGAINASPTVGIKESSNKVKSIKLLYVNENQATLAFTNGTNTNGFTLNVFDLSGRLVTSQSIEPNKNLYEINTKDWVKGVYLFRAVNADGTSGKSFKYIK